MPGARSYVGTSGWQYDHWRGDIYPPGMPKHAWLEHLAGTFPSVEVNGTFYSLPKPRAVRAWREQVPSRFRFAIKMWRGVTHYKKLKDARPHMRRFFGALPLEGPQRGPLLAQLPPNLRLDTQRLDTFLSDLRAVSRPARWRVAVEFRHPSWLDKAAYAALEAHGAVAVVHDMAGAAPTEEPGEGAFVYVRRHGPGGDTSKGYSKDQLRRDGQRVQAWRDQGRTVYVYYNNDGNGHAPRDARALMERLP